MDKIVTAIIDKQALFRAGVCHILSQHPDFEVYDISPDAYLMSLIEECSPDVMLLDIDNPSCRGLSIASKISLHFPDTRIIIMTTDPDEKQLLEIIRSGAIAYLEKSITGEELVKAIREVSNGAYPINDSVLARPDVAIDVLRRFQRMHGANGKSLKTIVTPLTNREMQIINYIADGNSNKQIAFILQISEQTAKNHVSNILRKLKANDRAHAVVLAIRRGWISAEEFETPGVTLKSY